jgi:hypothetical protein
MFNFGIEEGGTHSGTFWRQLPGWSRNHFSPYPDGEQAAGGHEIFTRMASSHIIHLHPPTDWAHYRPPRASFVLTYMLRVGNE